MSESKEAYERNDDELSSPIEALYDDEGKKKLREQAQSAENVSMNLNAAWIELSSDKSSSLIEHIKFAKAIVEGNNKAGDQFYEALKKSKLPQAKIKYYVSLLLNEKMDEKKLAEYKKALNKKQFIQIDDEDLDSRVTNLTNEDSIKNMKKPTPYKLRVMKELGDIEFQQVLDGVDKPYDKVDKKKLTKDEFERSVVEFLKEHKVQLEVVNFHLDDVKLNPLKYVEQNLELAATTEKLERVERLYRELLQDQIINSLKEPEDLSVTPTKEGLYSIVFDATANRGVMKPVSVDG
jgi:hypothetical protein